jgi:hypothetical protein
VVGSEDRRRGRLGARGGGRCRGSPGMQIHWEDPRRSCEGAEGVSKVRESPASWNRTADRKLTGVGPG